MSQISPPVRIVLIGAVVFLAAWFAVLRPKSEETPVAAPAATPATGLGRAVDKAKRAAGTTSSSTESSAATSPRTATATPAAPSAVSAVPEEALAKLPSDVAAALRDRKVLVLGVLSEDAEPWRPLPDDDRYVANALKRANRYDGKVFVKSVGLGSLSRYGALVNDLGVNQSPSIVVIDRDLRGTVLTGYVDTGAINQAIADARRDSIAPDIRDPYLRSVNTLCERLQLRIDRWSAPTIGGPAAEKAAVDRALGIVERYRAELAGLPTPARWTSLRTAFVTELRVEERQLRGLKRGEWPVYSQSMRSRRAALDRRFNEVGLTACAGNRTL